MENIIPTNDSVIPTESSANYGKNALITELLEYERKIPQNIEKRIKSNFIITFKIKIILYLILLFSIIIQNINNLLKYKRIL